MPANVPSDLDRNDSWPPATADIAGRAFAGAVRRCSRVASPALLVAPAAVDANIARMIAMAGDAGRLRPHLKTAKMPAVVRRYLDAGVTAFKCATPAEMTMAAQAGATDLLLACQPVGPAADALLALANRHPQTRVATVVDCLPAAQVLAERFAAAARPLDVCVDIDCGMHRTGVRPGDAADLIAWLRKADSLRYTGLHVYDGHLRDADPRERRRACEQAFAPVWSLARAGDAIIAGGTPTFPVHARDSRVQCSPGTCVFWDAGYAAGLPDMRFDAAARLLTRVISRPGDKRLCLDLGHKAVAAENPIERRVVFPDLADAAFVSQSEEHLVIETAEADRWQVGDVLIGIPWHVCPTVALYDRAITIADGAPSGTWDIPARQRFGHDRA